MERAKINLIELDHVYHVGTLNVCDRQRNYGNSLEGDCLSVSLCPHAWQEIAKLGSYDLHRLSKQPGRFLDVITIKNNPEEFSQIAAWAISEGLVQRKTVFRAWSFDEETEDWSYLLAETKEAAISEINLDDDLNFDPDEPGPDGRLLVEPFDILAGTQTLWTQVGATLGPADDASDLILIAFAKSKAADVLGFEIDGVWWNEEYAPERLSAPRGGIFPEALQSWSSAPCSFDEVEDICSLDELAQGLSPSPR